MTNISYHAAHAANHSSIRVTDFIIGVLATALVGAVGFISLAQFVA